MSFSNTEFKEDGLRIRKNYFWAIFEKRINICFNQISQIQLKDNQIDVHEDAWMLTEGLFSFIAVEFFRPKIRWLTTTLYYLEDFKEKSIEVTLTKETYKAIEQKIHFAQHSV